MKTNVALDCGAGIGRVTKHTLAPIFNRIDMTDFSQKFLDNSAEYLGPEVNTKVGTKICTSLDNLTPEAGRYDLIWIQWVSGHLTDEDLIQFFKRCHQALYPNDLKEVCVLGSMLS